MSTDLSSPLAHPAAETDPAPAALDAGPDPAPSNAAPRDWSMLIIMMAIIAALGFGGTAMMYRRAEASKLEAETARAQARTARDEAEQARKEALAQQRTVTLLQARLTKAIADAADPRPAGEPAIASISPSPSSATTPALTPVDHRPSRPEPSISPLLDPIEPTMPVPPPDMRGVLDAAAKDLDSGKLDGNPAAAGAVHSTLGRTYLSLGDNDRAARHLRRAVELRTPSLGANYPEVARDRAQLEQAQRQRPAARSTQ